jgi:hypothetical protein
MSYIVSRIAYRVRKIAQKFVDMKKKTKPGVGADLVFACKQNKI